MKLTVLGKKVTSFTKFETFEKPANVSVVECVSDEVTSLCPVTAQPDWYTVFIIYKPRTLCIESKTLKLYLQSYRQSGLFCEAFAAKIASDIKKAVNPESVTVTVKQKPRGGIAINATSVIN